MADISKIQLETGTYNVKDETARESILELNSDINDLDEKITKINSPQNYKNKKYLLVGDSYATGYQGAGVPTIEGYYTKVINDLDIDAQIICANGYGFLGISNTHAWQTLIESTTIEDKESFTDIIITGGMNDKATESDLSQAMNSLFTYLHTNFPNAEIHVGCVGRYSTSSDTNIRDMRRTRKTYEMYTIKYGNKYIKNSYNLLHNVSWFINDTIHPNTTGESQLAYGIEQYIVNGEITQLSNVSDFNDYQADTFTPESNVEYTGGLMYSYITTDNTTLFISGNFNFSEPIECNNNGNITLGKLTNSYVCGSAYEQGINQLIEGYVYSTTQVSDSNFVKVLFRLYNDHDNKLHVRPFTVRDNGNFANYTINQISFPYGAIKCSADNIYC